MDDAKHLGIVLIIGLLQTQCLLVVAVLARLVKNTQHAVQPVAGTHMQPRNLHNDTVVGQAVHKRIGQPLCHHLTVVVVRLSAHIQHGFLDVAYLVSQQIDRHHRNGVGTAAFRLHIGLVGILCPEVLTEAQCLRWKPCLLQFYQYQVLRTVILAHCGAKVDAEDGEAFAPDVGVFVAALLHLHHLFLQQSREDGLRDALVLKQILENDVVDRIGNRCHHAVVLVITGKGTNIIRELQTIC